MDLKSFKLNEEGSFSITRPYESSQIVQHMENFMSTQLSNFIITDATACMGGDLIKFSKHYKLVNGVEINPENFNILLENCKKFECTNINLICDDYLNVYEKLNQDIIYLDPPWMGPGYKIKGQVILKVGEMELWKIIDNIRQKRLCKYIFVKVPMNICLDNIKHDKMFIIYNKSRIPSFKLLGINV